jgi:hypothetical protein
MYATPFGIRNFVFCTVSKTVLIFIVLRVARYQKRYKVFRLCPVLYIFLIFNCIYIVSFLFHCCIFPILLAPRSRSTPLAVRLNYLKPHFMPLFFSRQSLLAGQGFGQDFGQGLSFLKPLRTKGGQGGQGGQGKGGQSLCVYMCVCATCTCTCTCASIT